MRKAGILGAAALAALACSIGCMGSPAKEDVEKHLHSALPDERGDFYTPGEGAPPRGVYEFGPVDIVRVSCGSDEERLYIEIEVAEDFPIREVVAQDGNIVRKICGWCAVDADRDPLTGCLSDGGAEALLCFMIDLESGNCDAYFFARPTGIEEPEERRYSLRGEGTVVGGGPGESRIILAYPLSDLGLRRGMIVNMSFNMEAESDKWHHFSFDTCPGPTEHGKASFKL